MSQLKYYNESTQQWEPVIVGAEGPQGIQGETGPTGVSGIVAQTSNPTTSDVLWLDTDEVGIGIPIGGTAGQTLSKVDSEDFNTEWTTPLAQSDINTALQDYYTTTQTDSVISTAVSNVIDTAPAMLDTLNELSAALNDDPNFASTVTAALAALVPAGTINQTARATAPTGYLLCDGSAISRTTYSALFDAIGTAYGSGDGSSTFNIPNLKGKVPVGRDSSQTEFDTLGETGGAKTHTLTESEMPSHTHIQDSHNHSQNAHSHSNNGGEGSGSSKRDAAAGSDGWKAGYYSSTLSIGSTTATNNATTATNQNTGGGAAHNNLQPYVVLNYMIKI